MSTFIDQAVEQVLGGWNGPDDWTDDQVWSNGVYDLRSRFTGKGYVGMFRYLGGNGASVWQVVDPSFHPYSGRCPRVTSFGTWLLRSAEYHEQNCFGTEKEAKRATIRAAIEHQPIQGGQLLDVGDDMLRKFWGYGHERN